jgi:hypothetical protein
MTPTRRRSARISPLLFRPRQRPALSPADLRRPRRRQRRWAAIDKPVQEVISACINWHPAQSPKVEKINQGYRAPQRPEAKLLIDDEEPNQDGTDAPASLPGQMGLVSAKVPRVNDASSTPATLWKETLSAATMSPRRRVGTRHCSM